MSGLINAPLLQQYRVVNVSQHIRLYLPPHLYSVTTLPSKTCTTVNIDATCFDLLMLLTHKQSYVTVMLNKCCYSSKIGVLDMSTVILHNTFKTTTPLVEATVNETL